MSRQTIPGVRPGGDAGTNRHPQRHGIFSAFLRMHPLLSAGISQLFPPGFLSPAGETVAMDLTVTKAELWKGVREGHQWTINKCRKLGFVPRMVALRKSINCVWSFSANDGQGSGKGFLLLWRGLFARLGEMPEQVHCCVVELGGEPAAACIFFECDGIVQAHLGGTKSEFLKQSPFHLLLYHAAGWAKSRGNRHLHLGSGVGGSNDRLFQFKRGFSRLLFPFLTLRLITNDETYRRLTNHRAQAGNAPGEPVDFFPAYRAPI